MIYTYRVILYIIVNDCIVKKDKQKAIHPKLQKNKFYSCTKTCFIFLDHTSKTNLRQDRDSNRYKARAKQLSVCDLRALLKIFLSGLQMKFLCWYPFVIEDTETHLSKRGLLRTQANVTELNLQLEQVGLMEIGGS